MKKPAAEYLEIFFEEKQLPVVMFEIVDDNGVVNFIPNEAVIEVIKQISPSMQESVANTIRKIDFRNGDVNHYLEYLAKGIIMVEGEQNENNNKCE